MIRFTKTRIATYPDPATEKDPIMNTQATASVAVSSAVSTSASAAFNELVSNLPIVIMVRAIREAIGSTERRYAVGRTARA